MPDLRQLQIAVVPAQFVELEQPNPPPVATVRRSPDDDDGLECWHRGQCRVNQGQELGFDDDELCTALADCMLERGAAIAGVDADFDTAEQVDRVAGEDVVEAVGKHQNGGLPLLKPGIAESGRDPSCPRIGLRIRASGAADHLDERPVRESRRLLREEVPDGAMVRSVIGPCRCRHGRMPWT